MRKPNIEVRGPSNAGSFADPAFACVSASVEFVLLVVFVPVFCKQVVVGVATSNQQRLSCTIVLTDPVVTFTPIVETALLEYTVLLYIPISSATERLAWLRFTPCLPATVGPSRSSRLFLTAPRCPIILKATTLVPPV